MLYHPTAFPDSTEGKQNTRKNRGKKRNLTRHSSHMYTPLDWGGETEAQSAKPFLMSLFLSPSIRMELGQHSAAEGRDAGRMGAHG